jgi:uncharacterized protein (UPF0332 family)
LNPVVEDLLRGAEYHLAEAESDLQDGYERLAGRESYQAMFHAAQAAIRTVAPIVPKTHRGVISHFGQLCRSGSELTPDLGRRLSQAYTVKDTADYGSVEQGQAIQGSAMVAGAKEFVRRVRDSLLHSIPRLDNFFST